MTKSERIFDVARYIAKNGPVYEHELYSVFPDLSERGMFRYLKTLIKAGVVKRSKRRYTMDEYWMSMFQNIEEQEALRNLINAGIQACDDQEVLEKARELTQMPVEV